jgi:hypothetical protein
VAHSVAVDACIFLVLWNLAFGTMLLMLPVFLAFKVPVVNFSLACRFLLCSDINFVHCPLTWLGDWLLPVGEATGSLLIATAAISVSFIDARGDFPGFSSTATGTRKGCKDERVKC